MCGTCGCNVTVDKTSKAEQGESVRVLQSLLHANDEQAQHNREHFNRHGVLAINLMSSPGAGKTSLLEATIDELSDSYRIVVIEGDLETENDAERIRRKGVPAIQISTSTACHLDAGMVHSALHELDLDSVDILFIENVGNLVCPASFDLGQHLNVALLSTPEGDDKPAKYPVMFRAADLIVLSKSDLLGVLDDFDPQVARDCIRQLATDATVIELSAKSGTGMRDWTDWIRSELAAVLPTTPRTQAAHT
jgi:hydrogenase nickel incorporation protein HypB